jgi:hypothetical protein
LDRAQPPWVLHRAGGLAGFVDVAARRWAIAPRFTEAREFSEGLAPVCIPSTAVDTKDGVPRSAGSTCWWTWIDQHETLLVAAQFDGATPFSEGRAAVRIATTDDEALFAVVDENGHGLTEPIYESITDFSSGYARFRTPAAHGGSAGFVDRDGEHVAWPALEDATDVFAFSDGLAAVRTTEGWGFVDRSGEWAISPRFEWVGRFGEGLAPARLDHRVGYIDTEGSWVITPRSWAFAYGFSGGVGRVTIDGRGGRSQGFVDRNGVVIAPPTLSAATDMSEGLAAVRPTARGPWVYMDAGGATREEGYTRAAPYKAGIAAVTLLDGTSAWIDTSGVVLMSAAELER